MKMPPIVVELELTTDLKGAIAAEVKKQLDEREVKPVEREWRPSNRG